MLGVASNIRYVTVVGEAHIEVMGGVVDVTKGYERNAIHWGWAHC